MANESKTLKSEAKKLANELRKVPGLKVKREFRPWKSDTRGYGCAVATWSGFAPVHLYFDRAAGSDRFRFWAGFSAPSSASLDLVLAALPGNERPKREIKESDLREFADGDWEYKKPTEAELARPYVERYEDYKTYFYGLYDWGGHATDQLTLDIFKTAQFIKNVVEQAGRSGAKGNKKRAIIDLERKAAVENEAIKAVKKHFKAKGFKAVSREDDNCGWDIDITKPGLELKAEVKGLSGDGFRVELSPNEFEAMGGDPNYRVCIVSNALSQRRQKVRVFQLSGNRWISDEGERLDVQEQIAARLTILPK